LASSPIVSSDRQPFLFYVLVLVLSPLFLFLCLLFCLICIGILPYDLICLAFVGGFRHWLAFCIHSIRLLGHLVLSLVHLLVVTKLLNLGYLVFRALTQLLFIFSLVFIKSSAIQPFLFFLLLRIPCLECLFRIFICIRLWLT